MLHKILEGITAAAMCLLLFFASGIDSPDPAGTKVCMIGILICGSALAISGKISEDFYAEDDDE